MKSATSGIFPVSRREKMKSTIFLNRLVTTNRDSPEIYFRNLISCEVALQRLYRKKRYKNNLEFNLSFCVCQRGCENGSENTVERSNSAFPMTIESDNGTPFTSKVTKVLAKALCIDWHYNIPYHPQSSGMVERTHRTIKDKITKACMETSRKWPDVLPAVLAEMRMTSSSTTKYSSFEILISRPFPTPWVKGRAGVYTLGDMEVILDDHVISLIDKLNYVCAYISLFLSLFRQKSPPIISFQANRS